MNTPGMGAELFRNPPVSGISRRALLLMPVAFVGLAAVSSREETALPNAGQPGNGEEVSIILFNDQGDSQGRSTVRKIIRTEKEWRQHLSGAEFAVTRKKGTEPPYSGRYAKPGAPGLYRCVGCANALFRTTEQFDSGTGWPSFWSPIEPPNVLTVKTISFLMERVEVLCARCDAHLGHVFPDGPAPTGLRYCINSVALRRVG